MDFGIMRMLQWERELEIRKQKNGFQRQVPMPAEETPEPERKAPEHAPVSMRQQTSRECA
jgi:hypothetical protein